MAEEVALSSSHMTDADLAAIATYLKALPGRTDAGASTILPNDGAMRRAARSIGMPAPPATPSTEQAFLTSSPRSPVRPLSVPTIPLRSFASFFGAHAALRRPPNPLRPPCRPFAWQLNDEQVAAVVTYIRNNWGSSAPAVASDDVRKARAALAWRSD